MAEQPTAPKGGQDEPAPAATIPVSTTAENVVQPLSEVLATITTTTTTTGATDKEPDPEHPPTPIIQIDGVTDIKPLPNRPPPAPAEADLSLGTDGPAQLQTKGKESSAREIQNPDPSRDDGADGTSETDSFPDFDYQTDLDMDSDLASDDGTATRRRRQRPQCDPPTSERLSGDDDDDYREPWNAVCVVGLRVYSLLSGADIALEVIRPKIDDSGDDDDEERPEVVLDPDDPAKGAEVDNSAVENRD
jgi:hypothetical protein